MVSSILKVDFDDPTQAIPAFICMICMPFMYSISEGIALGVISYVVINAIAGPEKRKTISPLMYVLAILFTLKYFIILNPFPCGRAGTPHRPAFSGRRVPAAGESASRAPLDLSGDRAGPPICSLEGACMHNAFCRTPLWKAAKTLVAVAQGAVPAELVIRDTTLVNVCTGELQPHTDVACAMGRIAYVGPSAGHCIGPDTVVTEAQGAFLSPGLLDGHIHIESSMMTPRNFAKAVLPRGTVGVYYDPHEICNVLGPDGVRFMMDDAAATPLKAMLTMPSGACVPGFEDTGGAVGAEEVRRSMEDSRTVALGEMMNDPGVLSGAEGPHAILAETLKAGRTITGHYTMPDLDRGLNAYIASGVRSCHESTRPEEALAKMRLGMYAMLREGSGWRVFHEVARAVTETLWTAALLYSSPMMPTPTPSGQRVI